MHQEAMIVRTWRPSFGTLKDALGGSDQAKLDTHLGVTMESV